MGLDTSHDAWHGPYSAFMRWREEIAQLAGMPPLRLMAGFYEPPDKGLSVLWHGAQVESGIKRLDLQLPISWDCLKPSPLHQLLFHSDCDGELAWEVCDDIANALAALPPSNDPVTNDQTATFIKGLRLAAATKENLNFH